MKLYHYTCAHSLERISGVLRPGRDLVEAGNPRANLASPFVWLTDLSVPIPAALGLTMNFIRCDRTEHRFRVTDPATCERWITVRRTLPRAFVEGLELAPGARPAHWWVSTEPVPVVYDPIAVAKARA